LSIIIPSDYPVSSDRTVETGTEKELVKEVKKVAKKKTVRKNRAGSKSEVTRQVLLEAAQDVFAEKGMDSSTIENITERADVGKGTFYYHFEDKNEIILELLGRIMEELTEAIDVKCRDLEDLEELIDALIKAHLEFFATRMDDFILYFQGRADLTIKESYEGIDEPILAYLDHIADLLDDVIMYHLQRNTLIRIAWAVAGFVSGYFSFAVISYEEEKLDETLEPVRKALVVGLSRFIKEAIPKIAETQQSLL